MSSTRWFVVLAHPLNRKAQIKTDGSKYLIISRKPNPSDQKPTEIAVYKKDSANHIIEARFYDTNGTLTRIETPKINDKNKKVGSIGHIGSFSFCQDKIMTLGGEGGMVTTHDKNLWEKIWPHLTVISCWGDANAKIYFKDLKQYFPNVAIQPKGLIATEGFISFPIIGKNGCALSIYSHFFEFIEPDSPNVVLPANQIKVGKKYLVIITTNGGLYRYRLNDIIKVVGYINQCPLIQFCGKNSLISDMFGEKISAGFVLSALNTLFIKFNLHPEFFVVAPEYDEKLKTARKHNPSRRKLKSILNNLKSIQKLAIFGFESGQKEVKDSPENIKAELLEKIANLSEAEDLKELSEILKKKLGINELEKIDQEDKKLSNNNDTILLNVSTSKNMEDKKIRATEKTKATNAENKKSKILTSIESAREELIEKLYDTSLLNYKKINSIKNVLWQLEKVRDELIENNLSNITSINIDELPDDINKQDISNINNLLVGRKTKTENKTTNKILVDSAREEVLSAFPSVETPATVEETPTATNKIKSFGSITGGRPVFYTEEELKELNEKNTETSQGTIPKKESWWGKIGHKTFEFFTKKPTVNPENPINFMAPTGSLPASPDQKINTPPEKKKVATEIEEEKETENPINFMAPTGSQPFFPSEKEGITLPPENKNTSKVNEGTENPINFLAPTGSHPFFYNDQEGITLPPENKGSENEAGNKETENPINFMAPTGSQPFLYNKEAPVQTDETETIKDQKIPWSAKSIMSSLYKGIDSIPVVNRLVAKTGIAYNQFFIDRKEEKSVNLKDKMDTLDLDLKNLSGAKSKIQTVIGNLKDHGEVGYNSFLLEIKRIEEQERKIANKKDTLQTRIETREKDRKSVV